MNYTLYNSKNISARTKSKKAKENCFTRNIPLTNILFYVGKGFMIKSQLLVLLRLFYGLNEHKANTMLSDLLCHGLIVKKQATDTKTCLYILTKFPLAMYYEKYSSRDINSIKLNNRKIWNNIYRTEFIIREVLPMMENIDIEINLDNLFSFLNKYTINIFSSENQMSVYQLYSNLYEHFPIKDKDAINNYIPVESSFMNDYYKATAELYNFQTNFLNYKTDDDFSYYLNIKDQIEREKDMVHSPKEEKKNYYSLFNMVAAGFFFIKSPTKNKEIIIGTFDKCNNMYLKKIYENIICIGLMLQRYLGYFPHITLQVYMSDANNLIYLKQKETETGFNYNTQEQTGYNKRDSFFYNMNIPKQYWDYIQVNYIYYPLREKYSL